MRKLEFIIYCTLLLVGIIAISMFGLSLVMIIIALVFKQSLDFNELLQVLGITLSVGLVCIIGAKYVSMDWNSKH